VKTENYSTRTSYKCDKCRDAGWLLEEQPHCAPKAKSCECRDRDMIKRQWTAAGINPESCSLTFRNFIVWNAASRKIRETAVTYFKNFSRLRCKRQNSILLCGQSGSGKTHATVALAINFLKQNIKVAYMPYSDIMTKLKQNKIDGEYYQKLISRYKTCEVLLIDDLFKGRVNDADISIMSEIINYRYDGHRPIIVSTEFTRARLWDFDEGLGSKITEMCKFFTVEVSKSRENNYRLK
jgi:DNA replication protein DnaC